MKKVGFLLETFPSPTEHFVLNELLEFHRKGLDFEVFALTKGQAKVDISDIKVTYIRPNFFESLFSIGLLGKTLKYFKENTIISTLKYIKRICIIQQLHKIFPEKNLDHIHSHFAFITTDLAFLYNKMFDVSYSFTCHAQDIYVNDKEKLSRYIKSALFVVTCTNKNLDYLNRLVSEEYQKKIQCVYHGLDLSKIIETPVLKKQTSNAPFHIVCVARLVEKKGIIYLLKALTLLKKENIAFSCQLIGEGSEFEKLRGYCKKNNLEKVVSFSGKLNHSEVIKTIDAADVFVLPCIIASNGDRDGLPNTILEAMALGKPVISTVISAIPEIIKNSQNGILINPNSEYEIYKSLKLLYSDLIYAKKLGANAKSTILEKLKIENSTKALIDIYNDHLV